MKSPKLRICFVLGTHYWVFGRDSAEREQRVTTRSKGVIIVGTVTQRKQTGNSGRG